MGVSLMVELAQAGNSLRQSGIIDDFLNIDRKFADCTESLDLLIASQCVDSREGNQLVRKIRRVRVVFLEAAGITSELEQLIDKLPPPRAPISKAPTRRSSAPSNYSRPRYRTIGSARKK
jgi:hypothetical protein